MRAGNIFRNCYLCLSAVLHPGHLWEMQTLLLAEILLWLLSSKPRGEEVLALIITGLALQGLELSGVLSFSFSFSLGASDTQCLKQWPAGWVWQPGLSMAPLPARMRTASQLSWPLWAALQLSACAFWHSSSVLAGGCLHLSPGFSREMAQLILEAKTVKRDPFQTQPEYLPSNQHWNLIDAKAFP